MKNEESKTNVERERNAEDQLVDWGLKANSGAEAAPELSDKILAAIGAEDSGKETSVASSELEQASRNFWPIGIAATLLFGMVGSYFVIQNQTVKAVGTSKDAEMLALLDDHAKNVSARWELSNGSVKQLEWAAGTASAVSSAEHTTDPGLGTRNATVSNDKSDGEAMMMVTPGIIIQEEEEERVLGSLDIANSDESKLPSFSFFKGVGGKAKPAAFGGGDPLRQWPTKSRSPQLSGGVSLIVNDGTVPRTRTVLLNAGQRKALEELVKQQGLGQGPEVGGDKYDRIHENPYVIAKGTDAVSTFSIDVDTASYSNVRQYLNQGQLPPPDAVRLEELVNYFDYDYAGPDGEEHPFATHTEVAGCPWNTNHRLVRVAIKGREVDREKRPLSNLVFLVDVSGSMNEPNKLPLVVEGLSYMTQELGENDRVSIVVYAGSEGLALPSTRGDQHDKILAALENLAAGGSTAGGAGVKLAYKIAEENFIKGGTNRVLLCTDGDFNVGVTSTADLERLAEAKAKETGVFLTVLGYGRGNLNDAMMETISNRGNGTYHYVDNLREARRVLVQQLSGTLVTIAKDVKIQVEFNPANVAGYRLLGYENRMLARQDFNDDTKDAGEVGAGHTVTAIYEVAPTGVEVEAVAEEDELKYQQTEPKSAVEEEPVNAAKFTDELLTLRLRYKQPTEDTSTKIEVAVKDEDQEFNTASKDFRFASSVAGFGMLLRNSQHKGGATYSLVKEIAAKSLGDDDRGYRAEFLNLIDIAGDLAGEEDAGGDPKRGRGRRGNGY